MDVKHSSPAEPDSSAVTSSAIFGEELVVLDSLESQVHGGRTVSFPEEVRFLRGNLADPGIVGEALMGVDRVVHLGALVGVGQSMYEISRYVRDNTYATAVFLERLVARTHLASAAFLIAALGAIAVGTLTESQATNLGLLTIVLATVVVSTKPSSISSR